MGLLIPENLTRKLDGIGRITLPKGLRDRMGLTEDSELEIFTARLDGRQCICLSAMGAEDVAIDEAIELLLEKGYSVAKKEENLDDL